jgi:hypothetical protein
MFSDMACDGPSISVVAAAGGEANGDTDRFARIKVVRHNVQRICEQRDSYDGEKS